jgi:glucose dehydrogenase
MAAGSTGSRRTTIPPRPDAAVDAVDRDQAACHAAVVDVHIKSQQDAAMWGVALFDRLACRIKFQLK